MDFGIPGGSWNQSPNSKGKICIFLTNFHISIIPYCYFWTFAVGSISKSCITFSHHLESMFYIWLMITLILLNHMCIPISLHKMKLKVKIPLNSHILKEILNIFFLISEFLTISSMLVIHVCHYIVILNIFFQKLILNFFQFLLPQLFWTTILNLIAFSFSFFLPKIFVSFKDFLIHTYTFTHFKFKCVIVITTLCTST